MVISWVVVLIGLFLIVILNKTGWPNWLGYPFTVIIFGIILFAGMSPILEPIVGKDFSSVYQILGIPNYFAPYKIPEAIGLIVLSYGTILVGMLIVIFVLDERKKKFTQAFVQSKKIEKIYDTSYPDNLWIVSLFIFLTGFVSHGIVIFGLLQSVSIAQWASSRAFFTSGFDTGVYYYAVLFSRVIQIGAWAMLIFSKSSPFRLKFSLLANIVVIFLMVSYGSRLSLIASIYAFMLVYHTSISQLRKKHIVFVLVSGLVFFIALTVNRFNTSSYSHTLDTAMQTLIVPRSIREVIWAITLWPDQIPFFDGNVTLHGWLSAFPTVDLLDTQPTWYFLVDYFFNDKNPFPGGGGAHFSLTVEHYIDFGYPGLIVVGIFYGLLFGTFYALQKRKPDNPFMLLIGVAVTVVLIEFLDGKSASATGRFFFFYLLPVGIMALIQKHHCNKGCIWRNRLIVNLYSVIVCFILRLLFPDFTVLDYLFLFLLGLSYLCCVNVSYFAMERDESPSSLFQYDYSRLL